jgi:hypothetical protein
MVTVKDRSSLYLRTDARGGDAEHQARAAVVRATSHDERSEDDYASVSRMFTPALQLLMCERERAGQADTLRAVPLILAHRLLLRSDLGLAAV